MQLIEPEVVSEEDWRHLIGGEAEPWGGPEIEELCWRDKESFVALREETGNLAALAGLVFVQVLAAESHSRWPASAP